MKTLYVCPLVPTVLLALFTALPSRGFVITNDTFIAADDVSLDGFDLVVSNSTVTMDGAHNFSSVRLLAGARLIPSSQTNGAYAVYSSISNEPITLSSTNPAYLSRTNSEPSSIAVTDASGQTVYNSGTDYRVTLEGAKARLTLPTGSTIPENTTVLVSYKYVSDLASAGIFLNITNDLEVLAGASIDASGKGYASDSGPAPGSSILKSPGPGLPAFRAGSGGTHGGNGGPSRNGITRGHPYSNATFPDYHGSGGGSGQGLGGKGGGTIMIVAGDTIRIDGTVKADGQDGLSPRSGGGAGGSIRLESQSFAGSGQISVNGGSGEQPDGGGGGGGRIAIQAATNDFTGTFSAFGASGAISYGGPGTVFLSGVGFHAPDAGILIIDNGGHVGTNLMVSLPLTKGAVRISGGTVGLVPYLMSFASLIVGSNSTIAPFGAAPLSLQAGSLTLEPGALISADGQATSAGQGAGKYSMYFLGNSSILIGSGGGYGGAGGTAVNGWAGGTSYGQVTQPQQGSPGGPMSSQDEFASAGGAGGGSLTLNITGDFNLDGSVTANGMPGRGYAAGGGSGGGIKITARTIKGTGLISANGGAGVLPFGGGGGGGRIFITCTSNVFDGTITAFGAEGAGYGGAGTVDLRVSNKPELVTLNNRGIVGGLSSAPGINQCDLILWGGAVLSSSGLSGMRSLTILSNAYLVFSGQYDVRNLPVTGPAFIEKGGAIVADGVWRALSNIKPYGQGTAAPGSGGGGGYGGFGGNSITNVGGGAAYGNANDLPMGGGSGMGLGHSVTYALGAGGISVNFLNELRLDGSISANGTPGTGLGSGGGAGGGINLRIGKLLGNGSISANGGDGEWPYAGGGGGGHVTLTCGTNEFTGKITAYGGKGFNNGGAGTIVKSLLQMSANSISVLVDNGGLLGTNTLIAGYSSIADLTISGGANVDAQQLKSLGSLNVEADGSLLFRGTGQTMSVREARIQAGGRIRADATGYASGEGPGSPRTGIGGGAGYGGYGGSALTNGPGGAAYGIVFSPNAMGSGGHRGQNPATGGAGGGSLRLMVQGTLSVDGSITAEGGDAVSFGKGGGGSGGGVWLSVGTLKGTGRISANGGAGAVPSGGGGGGGRIAIDYGTNDFSGTISAYGGRGAHAGGAGTIFLRGRNDGASLVLMDNGGREGTNTPAPTGLSSYDLTVSGNARLEPPTGMIRNLIIKSNSWIAGTNSWALPSTKWAEVRLSATNITIESGAGIDARGLNMPWTGSYTASAGTRTNVLGRFSGGGGAHGGNGGDSLDGARGGLAFGSIKQPSSPGAPGGYNGYAAYGGGLVNITVRGELRMDGVILADGASGYAGAGGGAGGSVSLNAARLRGRGSITANGGAGDPALGGGGGGGRIAIIAMTNDFEGVVTAIGGTGANPGGAGSVYKRDRLKEQAMFYNGDRVGALTPLAPMDIDSLEVGGGARVWPLSTNLTTDTLRLVGGTLIQSNLDITVGEIASIDRESALLADGFGYRDANGPGSGVMLDLAAGSGGGHGGAGGASASGAAGGSAYGSASAPAELGSRGGVPVYAASTSSGGGAIRLRVTGLLLLEGKISANGSDAMTESAGGGAGGSIWITAGKLSGTGAIAAEGGAGDPFEGGGGGGGRIAVYAEETDFAGTVSALGGLGFENGQTGSIVQGQPGAPQVLAHAPEGQRSAAFNTLSVSFDSPMNWAALTPRSVTVATPFEVLLPEDLTFFTNDPYTLKVGLPILDTPGTYVVTVSSNLVSSYGMPLDEPFVFSIELTAPSLSGRVTDTSGAPVPDVRIEISNSNMLVLTDTNGYYEFKVLPSWSGNARPVKNDEHFTPTSRDYVGVTADISGQDYVLLLPPGGQLLSLLETGKLGLEWYGSAGVTYQPMYSTNLVDWVKLGEPVTGTGAMVQLSLPVDGAPGAFFKVDVITK